jgi:hypothetical protein
MILPILIKKKKFARLRSIKSEEGGSDKKVEGRNKRAERASKKEGACQARKSEVKRKN